jgi:magnesium transporter
MIKRHTYQELVWIDAESPTDEEVRELVREFNLSPDLVDELNSPSIRPRVDLYAEHLYLMLPFPVARHTHTVGHRQEVDFVIGQDFLLTVHYDSIDSLHRFANEFETSAVLAHKYHTDHNTDSQHAGFIFYSLLRTLYRSVEYELEYIDSELEEIEESIFAGEEREMVNRISQTSRILLEFRQILRPHGAVLDSLATLGLQFFGTTFKRHLQAVITTYRNIIQLDLDLHELLIELRETNNSLLSTKENEIVKTLTIMAFVTFPLTLLAGIFGMNTKNTPFIGNHYDFWIILGMMVILVSSFFLIFKYKKWL